jgi:hypothetical protein
MTPRIRRRHWLSAAALSLFAVFTSAAPGATEPWEENQPQDAFLMRRLSFVLDGLRSTARADPGLARILERVRLRAPNKSLVESMPNAYAFPGGDKRFILIESRFVDQIAALSAAGAYMIVAEYQKGKSEICRQLAATDRAAKRQGAVPVFTVRLESLPEFVHPPTRRAAEKLRGLLADESMVWFLLHEAGHHALGHKPSAFLPKADSRAQESAADRWASQTMKRLGLGLFGPYRYLIGLAIIEGCLQDLGYPLDEMQSTHPSWLRRAVTMRREFDTTSTGSGYPRVVYVPAEPVDFWLHIAPPGQDASTYVTEGTYRRIRAASEWQGAAVTVYTRTQAGRRLELRIANANLALFEIDYAEFDASTRRAKSRLSLFAIQFNPTFIDWMEIAPGLRIGDVRRQGKYGRLSEHLRAAGAPEGVIDAVLAAQRQYDSEEAAIVVAYMKGQLQSSELEARYTPVYSAYEKKLLALLGPDGLARLRNLVQRDPIQKWGTGQAPEFLQKLEDELLNYNFDRAK